MKNIKKQVIVIHGGEVFDTYKDYLNFLKNYKFDFDRLKTKGWKEVLGKKLGSGFEVILLKMPNPMNAKYSEWKIFFDKILPFLKDRVVLIGHSLGGIFLAKYLSQNKFPKKILATFLVAAPYDEKDRNCDYSLGGFVLSNNLKRLYEQGGNIFIYHSKDDPTVPFADFNKFKKSLPGAKFVVFRNRGHFDQEEFPEIVDVIKKLYKKRN